MLANARSAFLGSVDVPMCVGNTGHHGRATAPMRARRAAQPPAPPYAGGAARRQGSGAALAAVTAPSLAPRWQRPVDTSPGHALPTSPHRASAVRAPCRAAGQCRALARREAVAAHPWPPLGAGRPPPASG
jgi:hypothetical protein